MNTKIVLAALLAVLSAAPFVHAEPYTGPMAMTNCAGGLHTSSTCIKIPAGATTVTPFVTDAALGAEAGQIQFVTNVGGTPAGVVFCPGDSFSIPAGATKVIVSVATPDAQFNTCGLVAAGVSGDVGATFS